MLTLFFLISDADIVVLDQPTHGMDIFDTFFLVEYLRQWAGRGRIVIMTLLPPTYEILTMISKIVLISMGKLMYFGKRREMLPYFAFIEYPCPAYKNPADYYRKSSQKIILDIKHIFYLSYLNSDKNFDKKLRCNNLLNTNVLLRCFMIKLRIKDKKL